MVPIERVEIHPTGHCTLACDHCQHGSHVLLGRVYQPTDYVPHLQRLARFARWSTLNVGGGEPFLHPTLAAFVAECHAVQPCEVDLFTNGYWLMRRDWFAIAAPVLSLCTRVTVSRYPVYVDRIGVTEWDRRLDAIRDRLGVQVGTFHPTDPRELTFTRHDHHDSPRPIETVCPMRRCVQLLSTGVLARCPLGYWPDQIPSATGAFLAAYGRSGFYPIDRDGDGFAEWAVPDVFEACHFCGLATGHTTAEPWHLTN